MERDGSAREQRDAEVERLRDQRDRLAGELRETRERFANFARASRDFASSMRHRMSEQRRLDLQNAVLDALDKTTGPDEVPEKILEVLGRRLTRNLGVFWAVEGDALRCALTWRASESAPGMERACLDSGLSRGEGLPGRVWALGKPVRVKDLAEEGKDPRSSIAAENGLRGAVAFPVGNGGGLIGVVELFGEEAEPLDEGLIRTLAIVGEQVGGFIERRWAEERLRASEERFRAIVGNAPAGVAEGDLSGRFTFVNQRYCDILGYTREELVGMRMQDVTHPDDVARNVELYERLAAEGTSFQIEKRYVRKDGSLVWVSNHVTAARDALGKPQRAFAVTLDITGRKQAEEEHEQFRRQEWALQAAVAERGTISRELHDRVAHEMAVVHQSLQLYRAIDAGEDLKASPRLQRAIEMTKSALDSTRNLSAELRRSDAEESLEETLREYVEAAAPPELAVDISVDGDECAMPGHVRGQVFLILREAVRNAVSHSDCRNLAVRMEVLPEEIVGRVEDDGHGFDARDENGHGVGLKSMKERAELLGGSLRLVSEPHGGAKIEVSIPLSAEQE